MKTYLTIISLLIAFSSTYAYDFSPIKCESTRLAKAMVIKNNTVTFINKTDSEHNRAIASMSAARTQMVGKSLNQLLRHDGNKIHIHVSDINNFNEVNDYVEIKTLEGHNIIYPISCKKY